VECFINVSLGSFVSLISISLCHDEGGLRWLRAVLMTTWKRKARSEVWGENFWVRFVWEERCTLSSPPHFYNSHPNLNFNFPQNHSLHIIYHSP
jgi:hypothetical protein